MRLVVCDDLIIPADKILTVQKGSYWNDELGKFVYHISFFLPTMKVNLLYKEKDDMENNFGMLFNFLGYADSSLPKTLNLKTKFFYKYTISAKKC